jgi:hypothetical protein
MASESNNDAVRGCGETLQAFLNSVLSGSQASILGFRCEFEGADIGDEEQIH